MHYDEMINRLNDIKDRFLRWDAECSFELSNDAFREYEAITDDLFSLIKELGGNNA